jgi:uncharacterized protein (DUF4415 family)
VGGGGAIFCPTKNLLDTLSFLSDKKSMVDETPKRKRGRPATGTSPKLAVRIPADLLERLKARVDSTLGDTLADVVRETLERGLADGQETEDEFG